MPNVEKTPRQTIRIEPDLWDEFGRTYGERHRSEMVRAYIAWSVRRRGATLPKRPPAPLLPEDQRPDRPR